MVVKFVSQEKLIIATAITFKQKNNEIVFIDLFTEIECMNNQKLNYRK